MAAESPLHAALTGETLVPASANHRDDARADIYARGEVDNRVHFDIRVFHPNAPIGQVLLDSCKIFVP